ncbi:hypothetical protein ZWY2020_004366 [Hordeum vulgare]|nr:hypothetical protein ZWY2020_004366 [Hordeum vulgare]
MPPSGTCIRAWKLYTSIHEATRRANKHESATLVSSRRPTPASQSSLLFLRVPAPALLSASPGARLLAAFASREPELGGGGSEARRRDLGRRRGRI